MAWYRIAKNVLDAIANAINEKTGKTAPMTPVDMVLEIQSIQTGGGGVEHYQFTQAEDWLTDATGNSSAFYNAYLAQLFSNKNSGFGFASITNNVASQYTAIYTFRNFALNNKSVWMRSNGASTQVADTGSDGVSFYISAGSIIDIYVVQDQST